MYSGTADKLPSDDTKRGIRQHEGTEKYAKSMG